MKDMIIYGLVCKEEGEIKLVKKTRGIKLYDNLESRIRAQIYFEEKARKDKLDRRYKVVRYKFQGVVKKGEYM